MKGERIILLIGLITLFLIGLPMKSDAAEVPGVTKDTILIGALAPLTGPNTTSGVACRDGAQTYFDMINDAGGINGRKLKVIWEDDGCVPAKGLAAVKKLIERDKVFALFGGVCSNALLAALPVVEKEKVLWFTANCSAPPITKPVKPFLFRAGWNPADMQARTIAKAGIEYFKVKKIGILHMSDEYGVYYRDNIKKYLEEKNIQPVAIETCNPGDVDFASQLTRLKEADPDVVLLALWIQDAAVMIQQAKKLGVNPLWIGAGPTGEEPFAVMAGEAAVGTTHLWPFKYLMNDTHQPMIAKFREEFKKRIGEKPGRPSGGDMMNYNGAMVFVEALKRAGKDPTRDKLVSAFESMKNFDSLLATPVTFSKDEHHGNYGINLVVILPKLQRALLDLKVKPY
jgi:branched-chain amino acid transport system substrate-binding protein